MNLLITGGAGYIGSHTVRLAQQCGHHCVVLDNFSTGHESSVSHCEVIRVDLLDKEELKHLLKGRKFDGVIHFAAKSLVGESLKYPRLYYGNNVIGTLNLLAALQEIKTKNIVFSSTAAIFGIPQTAKIGEDHLKDPINPYGRSKLMVENILQDMSLSSDINAVCLRYFNAAGADPTGEIGENHNPETHLIPCILKYKLQNLGKLKVFGADYPTPDGTCVRDYVHVCDLAKAHLLALEYIDEGKTGFSTFNLGNGNGFSVLEVIKCCEKILGEEIVYEIDKRRSGDPPRLVADSTNAIDKLGWDPKFSKLDFIIETAVRWHTRNGAVF